jgi:hypothetical protein
MVGTTALSRLLSATSANKLEAGRRCILAIVLVPLGMMIAPGRRMIGAGQVGVARFGKGPAYFLTGINRSIRWPTVEMNTRVQKHQAVRRGPKFAGGYVEMV